MDQGRVVEIGKPRDLAAQKGTIFAELLSKASKEVQASMRGGHPQALVVQDANIDPQGQSSSNGGSSSGIDGDIVKITLEL
jgi:hypothetical protein